MDLSNWQLTSWMALVFLILNYMITRAVIYKCNSNMLLHFQIPSSALFFVIITLCLNVMLNAYSRQYKNSDIIMNKEKTIINTMLARLDGSPDSVTSLFKTDLAGYLTNRRIYFSEGKSYTPLQAKLKTDSLANRLWTSLTALKKNSDNRAVTATVTAGLNELFASEARRAATRLSRYVADLFFIMSLAGLVMILGINQQHTIVVIKKRKYIFSHSELA
jgi:hypothetical protein